MSTQRQLQLGETIKRVMSEIFLRDDLLTIPGSYITISQADVSPDAKSARIYINIFGNESLHKKVVEQLNKSAPHFRYQMAKKIKLRFVPEISFVLDDTQAKAADLESLINSEAKKIYGENVKSKKSKK